MAGSALPMVGFFFIITYFHGPFFFCSPNLGGLLYILSTFFNEQLGPDTRVLAAELLAKLQSDKLTGPRWTRFIVRFLPPIFTDALRDSPQTA